MATQRRRCNRSVLFRLRGGRRLRWRLSMLRTARHRWRAGRARQCRTRGKLVGGGYEYGARSGAADRTVGRRARATGSSGSTSRRHRLLIQCIRSTMCDGTRMRPKFRTSRCRQRTCVEPDFVSATSAGRWLIMISDDTKFLPRRRVRALGTRSTRPVRRQAVSSRRNAPRP